MKKTSVRKSKRPFLVHMGRSAYGICVESGAGDIQTFAAEELSRYLDMISGCHIPIAAAREEIDPMIVLGTQKECPQIKVRTDLGRDGFVIKTVKESIYLVGGQEPGILYAVYAFLEHLGVRWLEPGPDGETLPRQRTIDLPTLNIKDKPFFKYRGFVVYHLASLTTDDFIEYLDWLAKNRFNYAVLDYHDCGLALWKRLGHLDRVNAEVKKRGFYYTTGGHGWLTAPYGLDADYQDFRPSVNKKKVPARYRALLDGSRTSKGSDRAFIIHQLCMASPDVLDKLARQFRRYMKKHPEIDVLSYQFEDGVNNWCECDFCVKKSPTDWYITVINRLAEELHRVSPHAKIEFVGYSNTIIPPKTVKVNTAYDNVVLGFALYGRSYAYPVGDPRSRLGADVGLYPKINQVVYPRNYEYGKYIQAWRRAYDGDIYIYDYLCSSIAGPRRRCFLQFHPDARVIDGDVKWIAKNKIEGVVVDQKNLQFFPTGLNMHLLSKLWWKPSTSLQALTRHYFQEAFGQASPMMHRYFNGLNRVLNEKSDKLQKVETIERSIALARRLKPLLTEARQQSLATQQRRRVQIVSLHLQFVLILKQIFLLEAKGKYQEALRQCDRLDAFYQKNHARLSRAISVDEELAGVRTALSDLLLDKIAISQGKPPRPWRPISWWDDSVPFMGIM